MKICLIILMLLSSHSYLAASYILTDEIRYNVNIDNYIKLLSSNPPIDSPNIATIGYFEFKSDGDKIYTIYNGLAENQIGEIVACDGLYNLCVDIGGWFKLKISKEIDFESNKRLDWNWLDYRYFTHSKERFSSLGKELNVIDIVGICTTCKNKLVIFSFDEKLGLIEFIVYTDDAGLRFRLSDEKGFISK